jgi:ABC-2 type transport system ATP-binding protein
MTSDEHKQLWSTLARKYDQVVDLQLGLRTRAMLRDRIAKEDALGDVVEFGCGTGFFTVLLSSKSKTLLATDLSPARLELAREQINGSSVTFKVADCQKTSLPAQAFDTAYMALVIQFTDPDITLPEMHRILKPGGALIIVNLAPGVLEGFDRFRAQLRAFYYGLTRYRIKPPKGLMKHLMNQKQLRDRLAKFGFKVVTAETIRDPSRTSNIPVDYMKALKA